jgi:hypothetical protein
MNNSYERPYGIGLVDDLHNFFPAILYTPETFNNTQDLLQYVSHQVREHCNIYNRNMRQFTSQNNPVTSQIQTQFIPTFNRTTTAVSPRRVTPVPPLRRRETPRPTVRVTTREQNTERPEITTRISYSTTPITFPLFDNGDEESTLGSSLSALFSLLRPNVDLGNLMEPVIVRPTQAQIDSATTRRTAHVDETSICSICQEPYTTTDTIQNINHCNHSFHLNCLSRWFEEHTRCPVCRWDIRETPQQTQNSSESSQNQNATQ